MRLVPRAGPSAGAHAERRCGGYARDRIVPGTRGRVPEPGPPGLEGPGTRSTPTCIRTTPRSGQSRESAKAGGPADTVIEAAGADPFGDCQVEGSLIGALRACGNLDAALSRAEAASRERPADTLIGSASAGSSRGSGVARESARERRDAVGGSTRVRTSLYRGVGTYAAWRYLTIRESAAAATEFRKIIDHKGATWAALRAGPAWSTAAQAGDSARAKQAYSDFFTLGKTPTRTFQFCWKPGRNTRRLKFSSEV